MRRPRSHCAGSVPQVTVYEAYPDPAGAYGSFVSLAGNGLRALDALGCLEPVQQAGFAVARQRMWSGRGKLLGDVPRGRRADDPQLSVTVMRRDLVAALRAEALRSGAEISLGERVASIHHSALTRCRPDRRSRRDSGQPSAEPLTRGAGAPLCRSLHGVRHCRPRRDPRGGPGSAAGCLQHDLRPARGVHSPDCPGRHDLVVRPGGGGRGSRPEIGVAGGVG